jgi:putative ABC transport system permease protein
MFRNYVTVAFRNLVANKLYSIINIGGLAVGLAACLLILLFVRDELSYEDWLAKSDRIAAVDSAFKVPGRDRIGFAGTPGPLGPLLEADFSSDIQRVARLYQDMEPTRVGDKQLISANSYVDKGFFEIFDLPMVAGDREAAFADNASVLLSETTAKKYFGEQPAIGNTITVYGKHMFTVVGVFRDLPANTHLDLQSIAWLDPERFKDFPSVLEQWTSVNVRAYVLFRSPDGIARVQKEMAAFTDRHMKIEVPGFSEKPSSVASFHLTPILDIHLHAPEPGYDNTGSMAAVLAFSGIALLILVIACINFVNLATARAMKRAREVAMRKVVGATRSQLVRQHLGEAIITAVIGLVVAIAIVELALGPFNSFLGRSLQLNLLGDPTLLAATIGLIVIVGIIGGLYPAVYLSRFRPASVLKANQSSAHGSSRLRTGLVIFQFAISTALVVCTATIYAQTVYARTIDTGFERESRLTLTGLTDLPEPAAPTQQTLAREIAAIPGVQGVALSSDAPPLDSNNNTVLFATPTLGEEKYLVEQLAVDPSFFGVYGVKPLAGRLFSADHPTDYRPDDDAMGPEPHQSIVVNMAFARILGAETPADVIGKVMYDANEPGEPFIATTIIGVVPDLYLRSVREAVTPLLYYAVGPDASLRRLTAKVTPGREREVARAVEAIWARVAPTVPIRQSFVEADLSELYDQDEQRGKIFAGFAIFAVLIACLGLFGLASFSAERRTKEIGMRKVLGASVLDIVRLLVWQFSRPVLVANLIAWPVSFYVMNRWLDGFEYHINLTDPVYLVGIFGGASLLALAIAWLTTAGHAYKVARANPGHAIRVE